MFEQGFIMRQVQLMVEALNVVLRLKKEGRYKEALDTIDQKYRQFFDHSRMELQQLDKKQLINLCTRKDHFSAEMAITFADMLREEGSIFEQQNAHKQAEHSYTRALYLYQKCLDTQDAVLPLDILETVRTIEEKLANRAKD